MHDRRPLRLVVLFLALTALASTVAAGCKGCDEEEEEERERERDHFWRAQVTIRGKGSTRTPFPALDCSSDGTVQTGECGPKLVKFKELRPATLQAEPAPGWTFDHWESLIREKDGSVAPRKGPMPDGILYVNGFGFSDTEQLDQVTAVFVPVAAEAAPPVSP